MLLGDLVRCDSVDILVHYDVFIKGKLVFSSLMDMHMSAELKDMYVRSIDVGDDGGLKIALYSTKEEYENWASND